MEIMALTNQDVIGLLQLALIAWGVWLMTQGNAERKATANTLNTHTDALRKLLEERG